MLERATWPLAGYKAIVAMDDSRRAGSFVPTCRKSESSVGADLLLGAALVLPCGWSQYGLDVPQEHEGCLHGVAAGYLLYRKSAARQLDLLTCTCRRFLLGAFHGMAIRACSVRFKILGVRVGRRWIPGCAMQCYRMRVCRVLVREL
jgi:hypothetical protein